MTRRFLAAAVLASLVVAGWWSLASAQNVPARSTSSENVRGSRPREAAAAPRSSFPSAKREIEVTDCLVSSTDPIKLPAREAGSIMELVVKRGYEVKIGDIVGQIDDSDAITKKEIAEREKDAAKAKADSPYELKAAKEGEAVAKENYKANLALSANGVNAVSPFDLRRSLFEMQRAQAQIGVAETEAIVARHTEMAKQAQIMAAENEIRRRKLTSPVDGVVIQVFKRVGDWAQPGDAIMEIVRMNKVEVDGWVEANEAAPAEIYGKPVTIYVELAGPANKNKPHVVKGHITFASQVVNGTGANRNFRVSTEIDNEQVDGFWVIQPGSQARMVVDLNGQAAPRPTPPALKTSPITSKVEALKPAEEVKPEIPAEAAPTVDVKPEAVPAAEPPAAELPEPKATVEPNAEAAKLKEVPAPKEEKPAPMPKPKAKPEVTRPADGADTGRKAAREVDVYSPRAYGSRTAPKKGAKAERQGD
ncbi:MAG: HlyD family efflux transporter periplasmic adaptor subunit [Pirellulaceae bacterium]